VYGRLVGLDDVLGEGDRVEILRPLVADPKAARRQRARRPR
jgi:putative ubiquitin-RnfH superfamily antitoxin RatB of RatAB toxin-antitoxin module